MTYFADDTVTLHHGDVRDVLATLEPGSIDCCVTSPPYFGLRDYGVDGQLGAEASPAEFVAALVDVFEQVRRVLADDGTCWLNLGDSYSGSWGNQGHKSDRDDLHVGVRSRDALPKTSRTGSRRAGEPGPKNLFGIPWRVAFALQDADWILRNAIIWSKPNAMPESVTDRLSTRYEMLFLLSKKRSYWFDLDPIRAEHSEKSLSQLGNVRGISPKQAESVAVGNRKPFAPTRYGDGPGPNPGDVWTIPTTPFPGAHFAVFPPEIPRRAILAGCKPGGTVLDPFHGSGTTGMVAQKLGRRYVGIDLNAEYLDLSLRTRLSDAAFDFEEPA